jgi:hypothetical protein
MSLSTAQPGTLSQPVVIHESAVEWRDLGPHEGIQIKDLPFSDKERGITLRAAVAMTTASVYAPRHRHTFDQVRYFIKGGTKFGRHVYGPGDCVYFPEGVFYGPQTPHEDSDCVLIAVQFSGPSGIPYPHPPELAAAIRELASRGSFEKGVYKPAGGRPEEAFNAVMRHLTGHDLRYPEPRYDDIVGMHAANYRWLPLPQAPGASVKHLGYFNEAGPNIKLLQLERGAETPAGNAPCQQLRFVVEGEVAYEGRTYGPVSCLYFPAHTPYAATSSPSGAVQLVIQLAAPDGSPPPYCYL